MILHAAEVWLALAVCFALGALVGSIVQRAIALTALGPAQASLIRAIDRILRWLERYLMPWRGTMPTVLPRTVPVPPPDFGHVVVTDEPGPHAALEAPASRPAADAIALPDLSNSAVSMPGRVPAAEPSHRHVEAVERGDVAGVRPLTLHAPRHGQADPLHLIRGVTKRHAGKLAQVGIFHFSQIASWTPQEVAWVAAYLGAGDALTSKDWVGQAIHFASADEPIREPVPAPEATAGAKKKRRPKKTATSRSSDGSEPLFRSQPGKRKARPTSNAKKAEPAAEPVSIERPDEPSKT